MKKKMKLHSRKIGRRFTVNGPRKRPQPKNFPLAIKKLELKMNASQIKDMKRLTKALKLKLKESGFMILGDNK